MALTVSEYLYKRMVPKSKDVHMNFGDLEVLHAQIAQKDTSSAQLLQVEAKIDLAAQATTIRWFNVSGEGVRAEESYASAIVRYEDPASWQSEWDRVAHLVNGRIQALSEMAARGTANKLSKNMTYNLFKNVVDYTDKYRGMQTVVLDQLEAYADITLVPERHGVWHTPPHWIDSVFHIGGLVMNGSDASNTKDFFYVTPGWDSCRLAKTLEPGASYRSYVKMFPTEEANMYAGDVYVLQNDVVVGMMGQMKFRRVPRLLMDKFFSAPAAPKKGTGAAKAPRPAVPVPAPVAAAPKEAPAPKPAHVPVQQPEPETSAPEAPKPAAAPAAAPVADDNSVITNSLKLIARETGLDIDELTDEASFIELGVDSLMSLVLSEKFRSELQLEVKSSLFLECPNIGELKAWLEEYC